MLGQHVAFRTSELDTMALEHLEELHAQADVWLQELDELAPPQRAQGAPPLLDQLRVAVDDEAQVLSHTLGHRDARLEARLDEVQWLLDQAGIAAQRNAGWSACLDELRSGFEALFLLSEGVLRDDD